MGQYLIVLEKSETGFSAYSPDVPGCVATGVTLEETKQGMRSALRFHLQDEAEWPQPRGVDAYLEALRESEGEEFYLTYIALVTLEAVVNV
jgi:predicted RNase H-like HicB family nuclease